MKLIQFIKSGVVIKEFTDDFHSISLASGHPTILDKESRGMVMIPSPAFYDYIEITEVNEND